MILWYCFFLQAGGCLDGVCGCLTMSGSYLRVSGICVWEYRCHINHKQCNRSRNIKLLPFLPVTSHGQKVLYFGLSVGCLESVCNVSGGCLGDSGYCLEGYNAKSIDKSSLGIILISWFLFSQWLPIGQICRKIQKVIWLRHDFFLLKSIWSFGKAPYIYPRYQVWGVTDLNFNLANYHPPN